MKLARGSVTHFDSLKRRIGSKFWREEATHSLSGSEGQGVDNRMERGRKSLEDLSEKGAQKVTR